VAGAGAAVDVIVSIVVGAGVCVVGGFCAILFWTMGSCTGADDEAGAGFKTCLTSSFLGWEIVGGLEMGLGFVAGVEGVATGAGAVDEEAGGGLPEPEPEPEPEEEEEPPEQREEAS